MNKIIDLETLREIYLISNIPPFMYRLFRDNASVRDLRNCISQDHLINEFITMARTGISTIDELVMAYAVYVAIILYDNDATVAFLNGIGNVKFEWFPDLKQLYLVKRRVVNYISLEQLKKACSMRTIDGYSRV
ncbi:MAG: hypothetical protein P0Y53_21875 [Candidatus Pseudobacter hemicellulosilyticus]|uniref:Uncharacterized protein n=1 Tax=Candidatus Pseudobacter hemicellulosilyticus TaxID=3121375 RepID=A0AAJ5WT30_9BACT|nr:MAG: hypothetical protein P0Y53_21875 [Pseudobacter sp.]